MKLTLPTGFFILAAVAAALTVGALAASRNAPLPATQVSSYGRAILTTSDADKRLELVHAIGNTASTTPGEVGLREPQAIEILTAAYQIEQDQRVKMEIINTVSKFSVPEAAELLNRATGDSDTAVRLSAQQAKARRLMRQHFAN